MGKFAQMVVTSANRLPITMFGLDNRPKKYIYCINHMYIHPSVMCHKELYCSTFIPDNGINYIHIHPSVMSHKEVQWSDKNW